MSSTEVKCSSPEHAEGNVYVEITPSAQDPYSNDRVWIIIIRSLSLKDNCTQCTVHFVFNTHTHTYTRTHTRTYTRSYAYTQTCAHTHTHACTHARTHARPHTHTHTRKHIHTIAQSHNRTIAQTSAQTAKLGHKHT